MRTAGLLTVLFVLVIAQGGCLWTNGRFDPLRKGDALEEAQKRFTRFLRWNLLDKARKLRFTDYEILTQDIAPDFESATIEVVFHAYTVSTMLELAIRIREDWYRDEETGKWWVRPRIGGDTPSELSRNTP